MNNITALRADPGADITTPHSFGSQGLLADFEKVRAMQAMAEIMSTAAIAVPAHFRGKPGDCLAVVMQAAQWRMNPFAVAQKTHVVNGALGYEAQLVNAVVQESGAIDGRFHYEYRGDGANTECRVGAVIRGEREITWGEWLSASTVTTKNSPLWKTNPKQQMGYLQVKNWARLYAPGAILGVYSTDELDRPAMREMGDAEVVTDQKPESRTESLKSKIVAGKSKTTLEYVLKAIGAAQNSADLHTAAGHAVKLGSDEDKEKARAAYSEKLSELKRASAPADTDTGELFDAGDATQQPVAMSVTYAEVATALQKAASDDQLAEAADLIQHVASDVQRAELGTIYKARAAAIQCE